LSVAAQDDNTVLKQIIRTLDVDFGRFQEIVNGAIDKKSVQNPRTELAPGALTGVPLQ
jgi:hypothetical protein